MSPSKWITGASRLATPVMMVGMLATLHVASAKVDDARHSIRIPKQIRTNPTLVNSEEDHKPDESGMLGSAAAIGGHGKYFQDTYTFQFGPKQYEFGHVCENPDEWEQRYERKDHDAKHFSGQLKGYNGNASTQRGSNATERSPYPGPKCRTARWGDKHGGYGEHYWDYNHAGHGHEGGGGGGGSDDEGSHGEDDEGDDGGYSHPVADYAPAPQPQPQSQLSEERVKRHPDKTETRPTTISLVYDTETGTVFDQATGQQYLLQPVN